MTDQSSTPAAGWYPDPESAANERWWTGLAWSDDRRPAGSGAVPSAPAVPPVAPAAGAQPQYAYAPTYAPASPYAAAPYGARSSTNGMALAGLIVSCASVIIGIFGLVAITGIVLSVLGLSTATKRQAMGLPNPGRGLAMAGLIVGIVSVLLNVLYLFWIFGAPSYY